MEIKKLKLIQTYEFFFYYFLFLNLGMQSLKKK